MMRMPASAVSQMASAACAGGTKIMVASIPVSQVAEYTELNTGVTF